MSIVYSSSILTPLRSTPGQRELLDPIVFFCLLCVFEVAWEVDCCCMYVSIMDPDGGPLQHIIAQSSLLRQFGRGGWRLRDDGKGLVDLCSLNRASYCHGRCYTRFKNKIHVAIISSPRNHHSHQKIYVRDCVCIGLLWLYLSSDFYAARLGSFTALHNDHNISSHSALVA